MQEFGFELALCAHLEKRVDGVLSRQLGTSVHGSRVMDIVHVSPGPAFEQRRAITERTIPPAAIESDVGTGTARNWAACYDGYAERAEEIKEAALACGFFERERVDGQTLVRQTVRYPDWYGDLLGIENKPDLDRPGALQSQLLRDVKLGLLDRVVLATASYVTGAHENRIPDPVGIWRFDPETGERTVIREPERLPVTEPGIEIRDRSPAKADIAIATAEEIRTQRRRVAERAYGKGWRTYDLPGCARIDPDEAALPACTWAERLVDPARECGPSCPGYEPAESPAVDFEGVRAARSDWEPDPPGRTRRQSGLDRFRGE